MKKSFVVSAVAIVTLAGCSLFGGGVAAVQPSVAPVLTCISDAVAALSTPATETLAQVVVACGVAAADVDQTVSALENLASVQGTSVLAPAVAIKIRQMVHVTGVGGHAVAR